MKTKSDYIIRKVAGEWIVVAIGPTSATFNKIIRLNETSKLIWDKLVDGTDEDQLVHILTDKYDVSEEKALNDIRNIIQNFKELGCIEE